MYEHICPLCKTKFYSYSKKLNLYNKNKYQQKSYNNDKERPLRTSTPIAEIESNAISSFSDSVSDFFYQSWKSGLQSSGPCRTETVKCCDHAIQQPQFYTPIVYINTVVCPPVYSLVNPPTPQVGYRSDGTFGVLPLYWPYVVV